MEESAYSPVDIWGVVRHRKWTLAIPFFVIFFISGVIAMVLPSYYESSSTILIEDQEIPSDYVMTSITSYIEKRLQTINQRVMSTAVLLDIIKRFNLYADMQKSYTIEEIVDEMRQDIQMKPIDADVIDRRTGRPTKATIAFTLSYQGKNPNTVYQVVNLLTSYYLEENLKIREKQAKETASFLEEELSKVKTDLAAIDEKITALKEAHVNELPELMQVNLQSLAGIERNMDGLNERLQSLRERETTLAAELASVSPSDMELKRKRLDELKLILTQLRTDFKEYYPDVVKVKKEISALEKILDASPANSSLQAKRESDNPVSMALSRQLSGTKGEIDSIARNLANMTARRDEYQKRIEAGPKVEETYNDLLRQKNNTQIKYNDLMTKHMESKIAEGLEKGQKGERFTLIEPPMVPEKPFRPQRILILLVGLLLSIGAGVGAVAFQEMTDTSIRRPETMASEMGYPLLSVIPEIINEADIRRRKRGRVVFILSFLALVGTAFLLFHVFVMDLNVFWAKAARHTMR